MARPHGRLSRRRRSRVRDAGGAAGWCFERPRTAPHRPRLDTDANRLPLKTTPTRTPTIQESVRAMKQEMMMRPPRKPTPFARAAADTVRLARARWPTRRFRSFCLLSPRLSLTPLLRNNDTTTNDANSAPPSRTSTHLSRPTSASTRPRPSSRASARAAPRRPRPRLRPQRLLRPLAAACRRPSATASRPRWAQS